MPYEKKRAVFFKHPFKDVYRAAFVCAKELGGKILKNEPEKKILHAQMYKRMKGETLGDRSQFEMTFVEEESGDTPRTPQKSEHDQNPEIRRNHS